MDRKTGIIIVICLIGFISFRIYIAMNVPTSQPEQENSQMTFDFPAGLPAVYTGTIPCASCPGINVHLLVDSTGFREVNSYQGENNEPFATHGTWKWSDEESDTLTLKSDGEVYTRYLLESRDTLRMLDSSGDQVEGDLEQNYLITYSSMENQIRKRHEELRERGFRFLASGNEPFWSIQVTNNDVVIYRTPDLRKSGSIEQGSLTSSSESGSYTVQFGSGQSLVVDVNDDYCSDSMSGFLFTHTVTMQYDNGSQQEGCGRFLNEVLSAK